MYMYVYMYVYVYMYMYVMYPRQRGPPPPLKSLWPQSVDPFFQDSSPDRWRLRVTILLTCRCLRCRNYIVN